MQGIPTQPTASPPAVWAGTGLHLMHQPTEGLSRAQEETSHGVRGLLEGLSLLGRAHRVAGSWPLGPVLGQSRRERSGEGPREGAHVPRRRPSLLPSPPGPSCSLTARNVQAGRTEGLASSAGSDASVGALVLWAHIQQDQAVLLGRAGQRVARCVLADPQHPLRLRVQPVHGRGGEACGESDGGQSAPH